MASAQLTPRDLLLEFAGNLEKKQRNLIKRKTKLDAYRTMRRKGETLNTDQEKALMDYETVTYSITAIKDMVDGLAELQVKVDQAVIENDKKVVTERDAYAVEVLQQLGPIWELLCKLTFPAVKAAVIKSSSPQQLAVLEHMSKLTTMHLPEREQTENGGHHEDQLKSCSFKESALVLFNLANGSSKPLPSLKGGKLRHQTYADLRQVCLQLLVDESVKGALSIPFPEAQAKKPILRAPELVTKPTVPDVSVQRELAKTEPAPTQEKPLTKPDDRQYVNLPAEDLLNRVINPLKTSFNFLQASHVGPVPLQVNHFEKPVAPQHQFHPQQGQVLHPRQESIQSTMPPNMPHISEQVSALNEVHTHPHQQSHTHYQNHQHLQQVNMHQPHPHYEPSIRDQVEHNSHQNHEHNRQQQPQKPEHVRVDREETHSPVVSKQAPLNQQVPLQSTKVAEKIIVDPPRKSKAKRGKLLVVAAESLKATASCEHQSMQAVLDAELANEQAKPFSKPKTWADLARGSSGAPVSPPPPPTPQQPLDTSAPSTSAVEHDIQRHDERTVCEHSGVPRNYFEGGRPPRGGFRGGRGRGGAQGFRGGRGRGTYRGSFVPRGDFQNPRPTPIHSTC